MIKILSFFVSFVISFFIFSQDEIQKAIKFYQVGKLKESQTVFFEMENKLNYYPDSIKLQIKNNLGNIFADLGENSNAIKKYQEALQIAKKTKDVLSESKILKNIGAIYISWKNFAQANSYYLKALENAKRLNNLQLIGDCYNNLGTIYEQTKNENKAIEVYQKALTNYLELNRLIDVAMVYSNLAIVFKNQNKLGVSIKYNQKALNTVNKLNDLWLVAAISNNLGNSFRELKEFDSALFYVNKSIKISTDLKALEIEIMAYETLAEINKDKNDFKNAFFAIKKMQELNSNFINLNQTKQVNELEIKYQTKQKELDNERLKFEKNQIIQQNKFMLIGILLVIIFGILLLYFRFKIKEQNRLNEQQLAINKAIIESENTERFRIARDLHDSVGQMLSVVKMHVSRIENPQINTYLDQTISEVRSISHNLIPESLNFGLTRALEELAEKISKTEKIEFLLEIETQLNLNKQVELNLFRILQEFIGNALKHANSTKFDLKISKANKHLLIQFYDHGVGVTLDQIKSASGLGWKNIFARLNALQADINFKTKPSHIEIIVPYE